MFLGGIRRRLRRWTRPFFPISERELARALDRLLGGSVKLLFVHSSLSACGYLSGGPAQAVGAWRSRATTLVLPTHSYCYPQEGELAPIYDPQVTPSVVGAISDWFWRQPYTFRSLHPTHSVAAQGPEGARLCAGHEACSTPCGGGTPYEKMLRQRASVLMFGCTMNTYTLFHTAEDTAKTPYLYYPEPVTVRYQEGEGVRTMSMRRQNMEVARRFTAMEEELAGVGLLRRSPLGSGKLLYIPDSGDVDAYVVERLTENPTYLLSTEAGRYN